MTEGIFPTWFRGKCDFAPTRQCDL